MSTGQSRKRLTKLMLLLGAVRWYNVALLALAQYIIAFFVFGEHRTMIQLLLDRKLHLIVLSSSFVVAGAFIINVFYDADKDLVNRSKFAILYRLMGQEFLLNTYAIFTILCILLALIASFKVFIFMAGLVFLFWLYSHKLQKIALIREVSASLLAISPLLAVWLHFAQMHYGFLLYLGSLLVLAFNREVVKDLQGNTGNIIFGYKTVVVSAGSEFSKKWLFTVNLLVVLLWLFGNLNFNNNMGFYSIISLFALCMSLFVSLFVRFSSNSNVYPMADALLKAAIVIHVLSPVVVLWM